MMGCGGTPEEADQSTFDEEAAKKAREEAMGRYENKGRQGPPVDAQKTQ
jgi:hypothetical protein